MFPHVDGLGCVTSPPLVDADGREGYKDKEENESSATTDVRSDTKLIAGQYICWDKSQNGMNIYNVPLSVRNDKMHTNG